MFMGIGMPIPNLSNLPGASRPGGGGGGGGAPVLDQIDNVYSMSFDGSSDYIDLGTGLGDALGSSVSKMSISGWFKTSISPLPSNEGLFSFGLGPTSSATDSPFEINQASYNILYVRFGVNRIGFSFDVRPAAWRNYCLIYDGTKSFKEDRLELYINGVVTTKINFFGTIPTLSDFTNISSFIGGTSPSRYYNGMIDEVGIFNYALTEAEVLSIYNATAVVDGVNKTADLSQLTTPPVAWYRMGD